MLCGPEAPLQGMQCMFKLTARRGTDKCLLEHLGEDFRRAYLGGGTIWSSFFFF